MNARRIFVATLLLGFVSSAVAHAQERMIVPVAGSIAGALGSNFRTEMQLHNPGTTVMRGAVSFLPGSGTPQSEALASLEYEIRPRQTVRYADVVEALGATGLGSLNIVPTEGGFPRAVVRAFDDQGNFGTRGLMIPALRESEAPVLGYRFALVAPNDFDAYRFNIGVRTMGASPAVLKVTERDKDGNTVGEPITLTYEGETFRHRRAADLLGREIGPGHAYSFETLSGAAFVYATTVDNHSNDGTLQLDRPVNRPPVINDILLVTGKDEAVAVTIDASDPDGDPVDFTILTPPAHGTLSAIESSEVLTPEEQASLTYTPASGFRGTDSFIVGAEDDVNGRSKGTVTIEVGLGAGDPPTAANETYSVVEGQTLTVPAPGVLANDTDPEGNPLTAAVETPPLLAESFTFNADGSFSYKPVGGYEGNDSFTYRASDGTSDSNLALVTIRVRKLNEEPVAVADVAATTEDAAIAIPVTANDSDADGDPLSVISVNTTGTLGTVTIGGGGTVNYDPTTSPALQALAAAASQIDTFSYTISDGSDTATATVSVTVTGVDDMPTAVADAATILEDAAPTAIAVLTNDTDPDGGAKLVTGVTQGTNGTVVITGGGTGLTYQPNANFCGSDSFTYTITGGSTATVSVTVTCVNDVPSFTAGTGPTVLEDSGAYSGAIASAISAGPANEAAQTLTFNVTGNTNPTLFSAGPAVDAAGNLTFTPAANANGAADITIALSDNGGTANGGVDTTAGQSFTITVTAVNDAPSFVKGADETVLEDTGAHSVNGWATAISKGPADEAGQTLTFNVSNDNNALFSAQPAIDASGNLTYTLAADASGSTTVTVSLADNGGTADGGVDTSANQTFTITVTDINDAPSFTGGADETVAEDSGTSGAHSVANWATAISRGPSPFEDGQALTFVIDTNDNPGLFSVQPAIDASGTLTYTLAANQSGTANITLHLSDDGGTANGGDDTSATDTLVINVTAVNDLPTAADDSATVAEDSGTTAIGVLANDDDAPDTGETLTITSVTQGTFGGAVVITGGGTGLTYQPALDFAGVDTFTYTINDGTPGSNATATVTVTVTAVNDQPFNTVPGAQSVDQLATLTFSSGNGNQISIADVDAVTPQVTIGVTGGTLALNPAATGALATLSGNGTSTVVATGTIANVNAALNGMVYDPVDTFEGAVTLTITTNDLGQTGAGGAQQDADNVTINVTAINDPPVNALPAAQNVNEDATLTLSTGNANKLSISDPDAGSSTVQVALTATNGTITLAGTSGLSFSFSDGNGTGTGDGTADATMTFRGTIADINTALDGMSFIPTPNYSGAASIQIVTNDLGNTGTGGVQSDSDTLSITVNAVNDAPVNTVPGTQTINEDATLTFTAGALISVADDAGTDPVEITLGITNGTLTLSTLTGLSFTTGDGTADASMVFTGTLTDVNNALAGMQFVPTANYFGSATLTLTTNDQGFTGGGALSDTDQVTINIDSVNDAPTDIALSASSLDEGLASGTTVGNLTTTDADTGDTHTYSLVAGSGDTDNASFTISGNQLQTAAIFDFETKSSYSVRIRTTDSGTGNLTFEEVFTITVNNVNEAPTDIALSGTTVQENQAAGTAVGNFSTTDPDTGDTHTYTLVAGTGSTDNASFQIVGNQLQTAAVFDFETKSSYSIRVRTTDNGTGNLTFEEVFTISVTNQNETPTDIALSNASINENNAVNDSIGNFSTTDPDAGDTFTYTLVAGTGDTDNASFNISGNALRASISFNFEAKSSYSIRVRSTDAGGLFVEEAFTITIVNVPEAPVALADNFDTIGNTLLEVDATDDAPQPKVYFSGNLLANDTDPDTGTNAGLTATLNSATAGAVVTVNSDGTFSYVPPPGHAGATDTFTYTVSDGALTGSGTVTIDLFGRVWYVKNDSAAGGTGTSTAPFDTLVEAQTASLAGDTIYVYFGDGATTGQSAGFTLKNTQRLLGAGVALTVPVAVNGGANPTTLLAAGSQPLIDNTSTTAGIDAGVIVDAGAAARTGIEIRGLSIRGNENAINVTSGAANAIGVTISNNTIRGTGAGAGIAISQASSATTSAAVITDNTWNAAGTHPGNAIDVARTAGTMSLDVSNNTNILSTGAGGINIAGGAAANTFITGFANNSVSGNTVGAGVAIANATFDANPAAANLQTVNAGTLTVGASGNGVGGQALSGTAVTGDVTFTDLDLYGDGGGFGWSGTGQLTATTGTKVTIQNGSQSTIVATGNFAFLTSNMTLDATLQSITSTNSSTNGISLGSTFGTFTTTTGSSITNAGGTDLAIANGNVNVTYDGTITDDVGTLVSIANNTGGTILLNGAITDGDDGDGSGVSITGNAVGTTITFRGGLVLSTGANQALNVTGGTINICDENPCNAGATGGLVNKITTTTGNALTVSGATIGANNLEFRSITSGTVASGPAQGVVLSNTGSSGGLKVKGTGSAGSGGTIQRSGTGISMTSTRDVSLAWMQLNDFTDFAIRGSSVVNFTLSDSVINGVNGDNDATDDSSIRFTELTGSAAITNCNISGGWEDNVAVINTSGTLNRLTVSNTTIGANSTGFGSDGILIEGQNAAVVNATVQNGTFTSTRGDHFQLNLIGTASSDLVFTGNNISNAHPAVVSGGGGIRLTGGSAGGSVTATYNISNNTMRDSNGTAIGVTKGAGGGTFTGTISGNTIGLAGTSNSGSAAGSGISVITAETGTHTAAVTNNTIRQYNNFGIIVQAGGTATVGSGTLNATVTGNTISNPGNVIFAKNGFQLNSGTLAGETYQVCLSFGGAGALRNSLVGSGTDGGTDFRLRQRQSTTVRLPGYAGANNDDAAVVTFAQNNNNPSGTPTGSATNTVPTGGGWTGGAACP